MTKNTWQVKLLPYMSRMLLALALFFFVASLIQLFLLENRMTEGVVIDFDKIVNLIPADGSHDDKMAATLLKAQITLQASSQQHLYHQAMIGMMARTWLRYLGFVTGMILAIVGATFVLGKIDIPQSEATLKAGAVEGTIKSASPGIILAVLGTLLMLAAILIYQPIDTNENAIYLDEAKSKSQPKAEEIPALPSLESLKDTTYNHVSPN